MRALYAARRVDPRRLVFPALKLVNQAIITVWGFAFTWVAIRALGLSDYAFVAVLIAIAGLVLQADFGLSSLLFARLRKAHVIEADTHGERNLLLAMLTLSVGVTLSAIAIFAVAVLVGGLGPARLGIAAVLLFAGIALNLPWQPVRVTLNAHDAFLHSEVIEFFRRSATLLATLAMLRGLPLAGYGVVILIVWVAAFAAGAALLWRRSIVTREASVAAGFAELRGENLSGLGRTALFSLAEFTVYMFPYYVIPLLFARAELVIAFDAFFKVTRFAATCCQVSGEIMLPAQTRAYHMNDRTGVARGLSRALRIGAAPVAIGCVAILGFGDHLFTALLGRPGLVPAPVQWAICAMMCLMLAQATAGSFLVGVGRFAPLSRRAVGVLVAMVALTLTTWLAPLDFLTFLVGYIAIYALGAASYVVLASREVRAMEL